MVICIDGHMTYTQKKLWHLKVVRFLLLVVFIFFSFNGRSPSLVPDAGHRSALVYTHYAIDPGGLK